MFPVGFGQWLLALTIRLQPVGFVDNGKTFSRHPGLLLARRLRKRTPKFKKVSLSKICFEAKIIECFGYSLLVPSKGR